MESPPSPQTTVTTTVTSTTDYYCYSTDVLLGALEKIRQCSDGSGSAARRKRAIEINGIRGFIGKLLGDQSGPIFGARAPSSESKSSV